MSATMSLISGLSWPLIQRNDCRPCLRTSKIGPDIACITCRNLMNTTWGLNSLPETTVDNIDRLIILATQAGLPVTREPYHDIALRIGLDKDKGMERIKKKL